MEKKQQVCVLVDFGGPRSLLEIESFLTSLLSDRDVVRTNLWPLVHKFLFTRIAKKRAKQIAGEYGKIGGKSPIYENTENLKSLLKQDLNCPVLAFHRYLPKTHEEFIEEIKSYEGYEIRLVPLFPQFTYATTGSCARFFSDHLPFSLVRNMRWVKSYPTHPEFIGCWVDAIHTILKSQDIPLNDLFLLFSFHGVPKKFIESGDPYLEECKASYLAVMDYFPNVPSSYAFQSQFGRDAWVSPSTEVACQTLDSVRKQVLVVPLSFTSDHIETLFEIEDKYLPILRERGYTPWRVPTLGLNTRWQKVLQSLFQMKDFSTNQMLIRKRGCAVKCPSCKRRCTR